MSVPLNILLVADSDKDAELLLRELRRSGFEPAAKRASTEADYRASLNPQLDLIFADYKLPQFSGPRAIQILHESGLDVPLILIAGTIGEETAVECIKMGAADYLVKGRLARLGVAVQRAMEVRQLRRAKESAKDNLRETEKRLTQVMSTSATVTYLLEIRGPNPVFVWVSDNVSAMTGFDATEALSPDWWLIHLHPEDRGRVLSELASLTVREHLLMEYRFQRKSGVYFWVLDETRLLRDVAGVPVEIVGAWTDVTNRRSLEAQLRQAQKMEAVGQLANGVAHDFNNLLTGIRCQTETVLAHETITPSTRDTLQQVVAATQRAADLTRQLLTFSRGQPMQPATVDLNILVGNLNKMLRRMIGEDVELRLELAPGLPPVHADPSMLDQVILNLAVNSQYAMPQGGRLTLATSALTVDANYLRRQPNAHAGEAVALQVSDTGSGIPPEALPHIFEPFFTTKEVGKGTGLGLATAFGIVQQHQGWIEVESELGRGTTFRVCLPARRDLVPDAAQSPDQSVIPRGHETLLVVEDEAALRKLVCMTLEKLGYRVLDAGSRAETLKIWEANADSIDLLLTDAVMPEKVNGWELAERLRSLKPKLKAIVMSGYSNQMPEDARRAKTGIQFLPKPFDTRSLAQLVRDCLNGKGEGAPRPQDH